MWLVTQGKGRINQLAYDKKSCEYVYFHKGEEIWREKGDTELLDYFNNLRAENKFCDETKVREFQIYVKYEKSCDDFFRKENPQIYK